MRTVLTGLMSPGSRVSPGLIPDPEPAVEWETLPAHPTVMAHSTALHRQVVALGVTDNTMLIGYGDWNANLGPVDVIGYDLTTLEPVTLSTGARTEAFDRIRLIDGLAYLPHTDPTPDNQGAYTTNENGVWEHVNVGVNPSMIHTFDVILHEGHMLVCGSMHVGGEGAGCVYRETAPGSREFDLVLTGAGRAGFARFHAFQVLPDGRVRVQTATPTIETWISDDGLDWVIEAGVPNLYLRASDAVPPLPPPLAATVGVTVLSSHEHDGWLWVGGPNGIVKRAPMPT